MKKLILLSGVLSLFFVGCSDDEVAVAGPNATIVGFPQTEISKNFFTDVASADIVIPVALISYEDETLPGEVSVQWSVDPSSTAVEGVEYDITSSTTATIDANGTVTNIPFKVYPVTLDPANPKTLVLNMTVSSSDVVVGFQYKQVVITLQGVCPSYLEGTYVINYTSGPVYSEVTSIGDGVYSASYMPTFASTYSFEFSDVCGVLKINTWQLQDSYPASGNGVVTGVGNLAFSGVNVSGVSWYVNQSWTLIKV